MLFSHKIIDEYYAEESTYPYPPKDIQLIILRYACKLSTETCKNVRLVRKCFYNDKIITEQSKIWKRNFDAPLKYLKKLKQKFDIFNSMSYVDTLWWYWETKINRRYYRRHFESIWFNFDYIGRGNAYLSGYSIYMDKIGLIEINEKYGELAILIKSKKDTSLDLLFFIYIDPEKNINYSYNYILSQWLFNDDKTLETLKYIETNDSDAKKDNVVFNFNQFELNTINTYCTNEQRKLTLDGSTTKYKGLSTYFANLDIKGKYFTNQMLHSDLYLDLDKTYPLTKKVFDDFYNTYW